jgi:hypothetical protein
MKHAKLLFSSILLAALFTASAGIAATTTAGINVSRGQNDSMAYGLNIKQRYDPWVANEMFELAPLAELGGHAWVSKHKNADTLWGGFLAPGLRFTLNTDKNLQPYLEGSFGGAVNNDNTFDTRQLGSHVLFRTRGSVGVAFGDEARHRVQGDYINYSTIGLTRKNDGYNTYGLSYGYSF